MIRLRSLRRGARKAFANRVNGKLSRGPRTAAGKARQAGAVRRHGLSLPVLQDAALAPDIDALAREIVATHVGPGARAQDPRSAAPADAALHALACRIAEAMLDLNRIRRAKRPLSAALDADPASMATLTKLARLDRYERRALARRKFAVRDFAAAAAGCDPAQPLRIRWAEVRTRSVNFGRITQLG